MRYLPTRKFIFKILIVALIAGAVFWFFFWRQPQKNEMTYQKSPPVKLNQYLDKDSDKDGLKDWEEVLWKTDPTDSDTDKDGTPDGEEVKENRDPLKPAPGDEFAAEDISDQTEKTLTQEIGRNFLAQYLSLKNMDDLEPAQKDLIVNSMLEKLTADATKSAYAEKDIKISSGINIKNYINRLGTIFKKFNEIRKSDLVIFVEIISDEENEYPEKIEELRNNRQVYEKATEDLLLLETPPAYKNIHLGFLNNFSATAGAIAKMELIYEDPAQSIIGLQEYVTESERIVQIFKNFKKQFYEDNINIATTEDGYIFIKEYFSNI